MTARSGMLALTTTLLLATGCEEPWMDPVREDIQAAEAIDMIHERSGDPDFVILDVRTASEFATGHIEGAVNLSATAEDFESKLSSLDKHATHLVYCLSGGRSLRASETMESQGFVRTYNVLGGVLAIKQAPGGQALVVK